jgi:hypothetical protein
MHRAPTIASGLPADPFFLLRVAEKAESVTNEIVRQMETNPEIPARKLLNKKSPLIHRTSGLYNSPIV